MPLYRRVPKRGFTNVFGTDYATVNVERLEVFEDLIHTALYAVFLCRNNHLDQV